MRLKESPNFTVSKSEVGYTAMVLDARLLFIQGHGKDPVVALSNLIQNFSHQNESIIRLRIIIFQILRKLLGMLFL